MHHRTIALYLLITCGLSVVPWDGVRADPKQPKTLPDLLLAFRLSFVRILTAEEFDLYRSKTPDEIRAENPELYRKVSQNVIRWTRGWIDYAEQHLETVPESRLQRAKETVGRVDSILSEFFESRGWPYRTLEVVFLPQRLMFDQRSRSRKIRGMFVPFYPDVFFATIDPHAPMEVILVHEAIHYNKSGPDYGRPLREGITEAAALHLVDGLGLIPGARRKGEHYYPFEVRLVNVIVDQIVERTGWERGKAIELLLVAYLTGDQKPLHEVLGEQAWESVIELSRSGQDWKRRTILRALEPSAP